MKEQFIKIYKENIKREGSDKLLEWLWDSDFFKAPASTRYHLACEGGLCEHSINVYNNFECDNPETKAICALLHDVCKINFYKSDFRNVKNADGNWEKVPYYSIDEKFPFGHGEKSVFLIERFMKLTIEEAVAIRFHMGEFEKDKATSDAYNKYTLAVLLHIADLKATFIDEKTM